MNKNPGISRKMPRVKKGQDVSESKLKSSAKNPIVGSKHARLAGTLKKLRRK